MFGRCPSLRGGLGLGWGEYNFFFSGPRIRSWRPQPSWRGQVHIFLYMLTKSQVPVSFLGVLKIN